VDNIRLQTKKGDKMSKSLEGYLIEAVGVEKNKITLDNPFRDIGFDADKKRLGWVTTTNFKEIENSLKGLLGLLDGKENFIFVGMGGSINGIKPLLALFDKKSFYTIDSLDPKALEVLIGQIDNFERTLVVSISKSGTTKETQLLAQSLREIFSERLGQDNWQRNFLWLSDTTSFTKLDSSGWEKVKKAPIQINGQTDIGGRFSSPQTLIFLLPLFLLFGKDFSRLEQAYNSFAGLTGEIRKKADQAALDCRDRTSAYFAPLVEKELGDSFSSWIVQLFQESLGSKSRDLAVKTLPNLRNNPDFFQLELDLSNLEPAVSLMAKMYFFQTFIAFYSAYKGVNFVNQEFVEKYKLQMRRLEDQGIEAKAAIKGLAGIIEEVQSKIQKNHNFIEIVLYFHPSPDFVDKIKSELSKAFKTRLILVFVGSDWNHQSYQAAFASKDTFYLLLTMSDFKLDVIGITKERLLINVKTLLTIAQATYLTLQRKALLFYFECP
jgi:hypothetical protein